MISEGRAWHIFQTMNDIHRCIDDGLLDCEYDEFGRLVIWAADVDNTKDLVYSIAEDRG